MKNEKYRVWAICPECGNSTWLPIEDGMFECLACGDAVDPVDMVLRGADSQGDEKEDNSMVYKKMTLHVKLPENYSEGDLNEKIADTLLDYGGALIESEEFGESVYGPKDFPVFLVQDDQDKRDIGVAIYPYDGSFSPGDESAADHYVVEHDCLKRIYGCSEAAAWSNAQAYCEGQGYAVLNPAE